MSSTDEAVTQEELLTKIDEREKRTERLEETLTHLTDAARDTMNSLESRHSVELRHEVTALRNAVVWAGGFSQQRET